MDTGSVIVIGLILGVLVALVIVGVVLVSRRRSATLQQQFGDEYHRTVEDSGDRGAAEKDLRAREKRRAGFDLVPLSNASAERYRAEWDEVQQGFVDAPGEAVERADRLVVQMMRERGYPVDEFDQRADDVSVDHPEVAQSYRDAHTVAVAQSHGQADTEQLRQAVTSYRRLVDSLFEDAGSTDPGRSPESPDT